MASQLPLLISGLFAAGIFLCAVALARRPRTVTVRDRLENIGTSVRPTVRGLEEIELSKPFSERVTKPLLKRMSRLAARLAPGSNAENIAAKLAMAGNPRNLTVEMFLGLKVAAAIFLALTTLLMQFLLPPLIPPPTATTLV